MPETTPTQPSAHLIQGNSSASRPGAHMPVTFEGDEPESPTPFDRQGKRRRCFSAVRLTDVLYGFMTE